MWCKWPRARSMCISLEFLFLLFYFIRSCAENVSACVSVCVFFLLLFFFFLTCGTRAFQKQFSKGSSLSKYLQLLRSAAFGEKHGLDANFRQSELYWNNSHETLNYPPLVTRYQKNGIFLVLHHFTSTKILITHRLSRGTRKPASCLWSFVVGFASTKLFITHRLSRGTRKPASSLWRIIVSFASTKVLITHRLTRGTRKPASSLWRIVVSFAPWLHQAGSCSGGHKSAGFHPPSAVPCSCFCTDYERRRAARVVRSLAGSTRDWRSMQRF